MHHQIVNYKILLNPEIRVTAWCHAEQSEILVEHVGWHWHWHTVFCARLCITAFNTELKGCSACIHIMSQKKSSPFPSAPQSCSGLRWLALATEGQSSKLKDGSRHETHLWGLKTDWGHKQCDVGPRIPCHLLSNVCQLSHAPRWPKTFSLLRYLHMNPNTRRFVHHRFQQLTWTYTCQQEEIPT